MTEYDEEAAALESVFAEPPGGADESSQDDSWQRMVQAMQQSDAAAVQPGAFPWEQPQAPMLPYGEQALGAIATALTTWLPRLVSQLYYIRRALEAGNTAPTEERQSPPPSPRKHPAARPPSARGY